MVGFCATPSLSCCLCGSTFGLHARAIELRGPNGERLVVHVYCAFAAVKCVETVLLDVLAVAM